ncbi:MAG: hypothetical protein KAH84_08345 [Thiomargarita sp.]|nr:hypothetical protein [Thiomargarita sp.]
MSIKRMIIQISVIILSFGVHLTFAATCSDSKALDILLAKNDYRKALQNMSSCLRIQKSPAIEDLRFFNNLIKQILTIDRNSPFNENYRNFQTVLKVYLLEATAFQFKSNLKTDSDLFTEVRQEDEIFYFYYDTGRMFSNARGIALTDKALIWKNITGPTYRLSFNNIKNLKLVYQLGLSFTGWQLLINYNSSYNIRLSQIPDEAIVPFVSALIYFINMNKTFFGEDVKLQVAEKEVAILAGWITLCSQKQIDNVDVINGLQLLDACFSSYDQDFKLSQPDYLLLKDLTMPIFTNPNVPFEQGYNYFKVILSTHFFQDLGFKFKTHLDLQTKTNLFKKVRQLGENYYFYFDTGTVVSNKRGIALTDKAVIWKNLLASSMGWNKWIGSANRFPFDKINTVTLIHKETMGIVTDWKLLLNNDQEIILSNLSIDNMELFAFTFVYFINIATNKNLALKIPQATQKLLADSFSERHPKMRSITDSALGIFLPHPAEQ